MSERITFVNQDSGDEQTVKFDPMDGAVLLSIAGDHDIYIPAACKGGQCGTCRVTVAEGGIGEGLAFTQTDSEDTDTIKDTGGNPDTDVLACSNTPQRSCKILIRGG